MGSRQRAGLRWGKEERKPLPQVRPAQRAVSGGQAGHSRVGDVPAWPLLRLPQELHVPDLTCSRQLAPHRGGQRGQAPFTSAWISCSVKKRWSRQFRQRVCPQANLGLLGFRQSWCAVLGSSGLSQPLLSQDCLRT